MEFAECTFVASIFLFRAKQQLQWAILHQLDIELY